MRPLLSLALLACAMPLAAQVSFTSSSYPTPPGGGQNGITVAADLDRDGNPDLITVVPGGGQVGIRYGTGSGHFGPLQSVFVGNFPVDVQVGDFNGDGNLDLVIANSGSTNTASNIYVLLGNKNRTFTTHIIPVANSPAALAVGDFNGDGHLDFAVALESGSGTFVQIYNGHGDGTFTSASPISLGTQYPTGSSRLIAADLNKDGKVDLINVGISATILLNNGNGTFRVAQHISPPIPAASYNYGDVADLNGDASPDLLLTDNSFCGPGCGYNYKLDSYLNDGTGHFTLKQSIGPASTNVANGILADINYDGKADIVYVDNPTNTSTGAMLGYALGNGDGTFQPAKLDGPLNDDFPTLRAHDLNNDGLLDVISTGPAALEVKLNTSAIPDCSSPNSSNLAAHVCSPASGATVNSPITVRATANAPADVQRIEEWLDGKKVYQQLSNQLRTTLSASVGTHTLTIIPVDIFGHFVKQNVSFTVGSSSGCVAPSSSGVKICAPASGASVTSPVSVTAVATAAGGTSIVSMQLYVDNVAKYNVKGPRLSTSVALPAGSHYLAVVAYEANGAALKATETISVH